LAVIALNLTNKWSVIQIIVTASVLLMKFKYQTLAQNANQKPETGGNKLEIQERLKEFIIQSTELKHATDNTVIKDSSFPWSLLNYSMEDFKNELALGSLEFMALVIDIEDEFKINITDDQLLEVITVGDFVSLVEKLVPATD